MGSPPDTPEPPAVVAAREGLATHNKRVAGYVAAIVALTAAMVGVGAATKSELWFWTTFAVMMVVTFAGIPWMQPKQMAKDQQTVREWEARGLREEFARFDRQASATATADPRMEAAAGMADRIRALQASDPDTDTMVTNLETRLGQLITDSAAAKAAVEALDAAGAGGPGTERLSAAAAHLESEIARILSGLSDLYAALLEAESGNAAATTQPEVMAWLSAEAEIARASQDEAMRPAREAAETGAKVTE